MSERKRLAGMLDFAAGLLVSREKARIQMGEAGSAVWRKPCRSSRGVIHDLLKRCEALSPIN